MGLHRKSGRKSGNLEIWIQYLLAGQKNLELERYSHEGYLINVVVMAVAGRSLDMVEPNPIHGQIIIKDLKLGEKAREQELHIRSAVDVVMF